MNVVSNLTHGSRNSGKEEFKPLGNYLSVAKCHCEKTLESISELTGDSNSHTTCEVE